MQNKMLLGQIISGKKVIYQKAKYFGYTHSSAVACSQELYMLHNQYQEIQGSFELPPEYSLRLLNVGDS